MRVFVNVYVNVRVKVRVDVFVGESVAVGVAVPVGVGVWVVGVGVGTGVSVGAGVSVGPGVLVATGGLIKACVGVVNHKQASRRRMIMPLLDIRVDKARVEQDASLGCMAIPPPPSSVVSPRTGMPPHSEPRIFHVEWNKSFRPSHAVGSHPCQDLG